ncbi:uncharacterized protein LACBIDRAFT_330871 [Laccaria bicolor S238N-H82]|uniref:Predicted protein n=1 Tax=Laccaria bicolor (strain S238N-H82 / ATCC MYA-4686) TaxID=486041 RepID=B0DN10_LACBS|nr:uncharacterized protein LACBIDRAFT_330871 [Laccaria bicolor S238N-H82]EDR04066.1 predicted protein [Laccaria bicolor S238N-H82]|eukprot:XP_001885321.1 predicted protein [Laccaria bicolor S238N-H82]
MSECRTSLKFPRSNIEHGRLKRVDTTDGLRTKYRALWAMKKTIVIGIFTPRLLEAWGIGGRVLDHPGLNLLYNGLLNATITGVFEVTFHASLRSQMDHGSCSSMTIRRRISRLKHGFSCLKTRVLSFWRPCVGGWSDEECGEAEPDGSTGTHDPVLPPVATSPINLLPVEILGEVFLACLLSGGESQHHLFIKPEPRSAPMLLCQVCSRWRQTALSMPSLWSSISTARITQLHQISLLLLWLERSHTSPLSFHLLGSRETPRPEFVSTILSTFLSHTHRWEHVSIVFNEKLAAQFLELSSNTFPQLISIKADVIGCGQAVTEAFPYKMSTISGLRRVSFMTSRTPSSLMVVRWHRLTHVYVSGLPSLASSIFLLGHCREAVEVQLESIMPTDAEPPSTFVLDPLTTLPNLRTLVVTVHEDVGDLLQHFDTPALHYLNILQSSIDGSISRECGAFSDFVERSPQLKKVVITDFGGSENDIIAYLDPVYHQCTHEVFLSSPSVTPRIADMFNERVGIGPEATTQPHVEVDDSIVGWLPDSRSGGLFDRWMSHQTQSRNGSFCALFDDLL